MPVKAIQKASAAIKAKFSGATIRSRKIEGTDRYQMLIVSDKFAGMSPYRRQDAVWNVISEAVTADEILKIGFVLPVPPTEIADKSARQRRTAPAKLLQPN